MVEIYGITVAKVNEDLKLTSVEHFFDNSQFLESLTSSGTVAFHEYLQTGFFKDDAPEKKTSGCPFAGFFKK